MTVERPRGTIPAREAHVWLCLRAHAGPTRGALDEQGGGRPSAGGSVRARALRAAGTACPRPGCSPERFLPVVPGEDRARRAEELGSDLRPTPRPPAPPPWPLPGSLLCWVPLPGQEGGQGARRPLGHPPNPGSPRPPGRQWRCRGLASRVAPAGRAAGRLPGGDAGGGAAPGLG